MTFALCIAFASFFISTARFFLVAVFICSSTGAAVAKTQFKVKTSRSVIGTRGGFKKAERRFATGFGATITLSHPQADWKSALRPVCPGDGFFLESALVGIWGADFDLDACGQHVIVRGKAAMDHKNPHMVVACGGPVAQVQMFDPATGAAKPALLAVLVESAIELDEACDILFLLGSKNAGVQLWSKASSISSVQIGKPR